MKKILFLFTILALTSKLCYAQNVVAGIEFGKTSYEEAAPKLIKKFGEPSYKKLNHAFTFKYVSYAGLMFDNICFFFENTEASVFTPETKFRELDEWSSLLALSILAMVDEEYDVQLKGEEMRATNTIQELFDLVSSKL